MIKRKDGSYSQRGLWDNIRANRGSGKKPTKQMLQQEKKIKAKAQMGIEKGENPYGNNPNILRPVSTVFPSPYSVSTNTNVETEESTPRYVPRSRGEKREQFRNLVRSSDYPVMKKRNNGKEYESRSATMSKLLATSPSESGMSLRRMRRLGQKTFGEPRRETMSQYRNWYPISGIRTEQSQNRPQNANIARKRRSALRQIRGSAGPGRCAGGDCNKMKNGGATSKLKQAYLKKYK